VFDCQPDALVIVPPRKTAVESSTGDTQRDQHIKDIANKGRITWQRETAYNLRSYAELRVACDATIQAHFWQRDESKSLAPSKTEAGISASALNRMANLGMPVYVKV
jgi:hypothetical protein